MGDNNNIRDWFSENVDRGLDGFLGDIVRDLHEVDKPETRAKLKMDFVKMVEQVLCVLPHLTVGSGNKAITFNFEEITQAEIDEHWIDDET